MAGQDGAEMSVSTFERSAVRPGTRGTVRGSRASLQRGPVASPWQPTGPGGRPSQPSRPATRTVVSHHRVKTAAFAQPEQFQLTDRALTLLVIGFLAAILIGAAVVVGQFIAVSDAPTPASAAAPAAIVAPVTQG